MTTIKVSELPVVTTPYDGSEYTLGIQNGISVKVPALNLASATGASLIGTTPTGTLAASTVAASLTELDTEKASTAALSSGLALKADTTTVNSQLALKTSITSLSASTGSTLVGTTTGGTGSVARTVASKVNDTVSVKDFGAVGNGVTNDTAAIQAAINYAITNSFTVSFPNGNYLIQSAINIPAATIGLIGNISSTITLGTSGTINFTSNAENIYIDALEFVSNSTLPTLNFIGTGGLYLNMTNCKVFSNNASTASSAIVMVGAFGSMSNCQFYLGTGNSYAVVINASSANFSFSNCHSTGQQTVAFAYLDGSATVFGVQGIRFIGCTLLDYNNGITANAGVSGAVDSVIISGCMIDSMQIPIQFTGVLNGCISGSYVGGNSATISPISLENCTQFTMTGCNAESYGAGFTVNPPPRLIYLNGGNDVRFIGNGWKLSGNTSAIAASSIFPSLLAMVGNQGVQDFIETNPTQFDSSSTLATTSSVASTGRIFNIQNIITGAATLAITACGVLNTVNSATAVTVTLPNLTLAPSFRGSMYIYNYGVGAVTLAAYSGQTIRAASLTVATNQFIEMVNDVGGSSWRVINRGASL